MVTSVEDISRTHCAFLIVYITYTSLLIGYQLWHTHQMRENIAQRPWHNISHLFKETWRSTQKPYSRTACAQTEWGTWSWWCIRTGFRHDTVCSVSWWLLCFIMEWILVLVMTYWERFGVGSSYTYTKKLKCVSWSVIFLFKGVF